MKNIIVLVLCTFFVSVGYAQLGVNTVVPLHLVHIDAMRNNPVDQFPTASEVKDDIVVTKDGNLGIGKVDPVAEIEIKGTLRIKDGTEGLNKILMSDVNGLAQWKKVPYDIPTVIGEFASTSKVRWRGTEDEQSHIYSNYKITLTKGRWVVNTGLLINMKSSSDWLLAILSSNNTKKEMTGFKFITLAQRNTAYAANIRAGKGMLGGSSIIEVLDDTLALYVLLRKTGNWEFDPNGAQNYLYATPIL